MVYYWLWFHRVAHIFQSTGRELHAGGGGGGGRAGGGRRDVKKDK
jgi:hypothetical protein